MSTKKTIAIMTETLQGNPFIELTLGLDPFLGVTNERMKTQKTGSEDVRHRTFAPVRMLAINLELARAGRSLDAAKKDLRIALAALVMSGAYSEDQAERVGTAARKIVTGDGKPSASLIVKNEDKTVNIEASHENILKRAKTINAVNKYFAKDPTEAEQQAAALKALDKAVRGMIAQRVAIDDRTKAIIIAHVSTTVEKVFVELGRNSNGNPARPVNETHTVEEPDTLSPAALDGILAEEAATAATA